MTQVRDRERKVAVDSYNLARMRQGIHYHGRYQGFDTITDISGLDFSISHDGGAHKNYARDTYSATNNLGKWITRQGISVQEDAKITGLSCASNAANAFQRIDLLVGSHEYSDSVTGGNAATYSIIQGANGGPVIPALTSANQVLLGYIYVAASAATLASAIYIPAEVLGNGGERVAKKDKVNDFTKLNQFASDATVRTLVYGVLGDSVRSISYVALTDEGNSQTFQCTNSNQQNVYGMKAKQRGTIMRVNFINNGGGIPILHDNELNADELAAGYLHFSLGEADSVMHLKGTDNNWLTFICDIPQPGGVLCWILMAVARPFHHIVGNEIPLVGATLHADAEGLVTAAASTYFYKDLSGRVYFAGEEIKATADIAIGETLFTLPVGYRPYTNASGANTHRGSIFLNAHRRPTMVLTYPTETVLLEITEAGAVVLVNSSIPIWDTIDLRTLSFLAN